MSTAFHPRAAQDGFQWTACCTAIAIIVIVAGQYGYLQEACCSIIGVYCCWQGFLPYLSLAIELKWDARKNRQTIQQLETMDEEDMQHLGDVDPAGGGTVLGLVVYIARMAHLPAEIATKKYLEVVRQGWKPRTDAVHTASESAPLLAFGSSLTGLLGGVSHLATALLQDVENAQAFAAMFASLQTMLSTSVLGCFLAFTLVGLSKRLDNAIGRYEAELWATAGRLGDREDPPAEDEDEDPDRLF